MNTYAKLSELSWLCLPKQMTKEEFQELVSAPLPFHRTSIDLNAISVFRFPDEYQLNEQKIFNLDKIRQRRIKTKDQCVYRQLKEGIYQRIPTERNSSSSKVIQEYHPKKNFYGRTITVDDIMCKKIDILDSLGKVFEQTCTKKQEYVNDFELFPNQTKNYWHPFALDTLECPLYTDQSLNTLDGINRPWNYFGKFGTSSPFHIDDFNLSSAIFHVAGCTKVWIVIPSTYTKKFEDALGKNVPKEALAKVATNCKRKWTCAKVLVTPQNLTEWGIRHVIVCQNPGDYIMLMGGSYHAVFNYGGNIARSVNYNDDRYFEMENNECTCKPKNQMKFPFNIHTMQQHWHKYQEERIDWAKRLRMEFPFMQQTLFPVSANESVLPCSSAIASGSGSADTQTPQVQTIEEPSTGEPSSHPRTGKDDCKKQGKNSKRPRDESPPKKDIPCKKTFNCTVEGCTKVFPFLCRMNAHVREFHNKEAKVMCEQCGQSFCGFKNLKRHMQNGICLGKGKDGQGSSK